MQLFSITADHAILCDTSLCRAEVRMLNASERLNAAPTPPVEVVLCVLTGELAVQAGDENLHLGAMQGVQIPAGMGWAAQPGANGAKYLRVDSMHPNLEPEKTLMERLQQPHRFAVADGQRLVYTDYVRGGVLNFAPGFAADKHFHQDADEIFWFFQGTCRVTTPDGEVLAPAGTIVYTVPGEWHIIENAGDEPLLMFLTVTPNIVPSHTFFHPDGTPWVRSWEPLRRP